MLKGTSCGTAVNQREDMSAISTVRPKPGAQVPRHARRGSAVRGGHYTTHLLFGNSDPQ